MPNPGPLLVVGGPTVGLTFNGTTDDNKATPVPPLHDGTPARYVSIRATGDPATGTYFRQGAVGAVMVSDGQGMLVNRFSPLLINTHGAGTHIHIWSLGGQNVNLTPMAERPRS